MNKNTSNFTSAALALLPMIIGESRRTQIISIAQILAHDAGLAEVSAAIVMEAAKEVA